MRDGGAYPERGYSMNVYCLFCETIHCRNIATAFEQVLGCRCIAPQIAQSKWIRGELTEKKHDWLPGYIFIYAEESVSYYRMRHSVAGVIRCLGDDAADFVLSGEDLSFARMIYDCDGVIGRIKLAEVGDRVRIADPLWKDMHGTVIKLDRHRKRCCVSFRFDTIERNVWVGYELVENIE